MTINARNTINWRLTIEPAVTSDPMPSYPMPFDAYLTLVEAYLNLPRYLMYVSM